MSVQHKRHITKAITWRIFATTDTFIISWIITGSIYAGLSIGFIEFFSKMLFYYIHERAWYKTKWGITE